MCLDLAKFKWHVMLNHALNYEYQILLLMWRGCVLLTLTGCTYLFSFYCSDFPSLSYRMTMVTLQSTKIEPPVSFLPLQKFLECQDWYLGIMASWMMVKIHFRSCQILLTNDSTSYVVETKMGIYVLVYLASSL